ncbi:MAG TPA: hypothetical protein VGA55_09400, partial [Bacteroidota bacterium]
LELPDFRSVGILNCNLHFQGSPSRFKAFVGGRISAGEFTADADLDLRKGFAYSGTITTAGLDLGSLLDDEYLSSSLTTTSTIAGSGTSLNTLTAVFRLEADSSAILDRPVSKSVVVVDVADQSLRTNLLLNVGETRIDLNARSNFAIEDSVTYNLKGKVYSLDLATLLRNPRFESNLSFTLDANGRGFDLDTMSVNTQVHFLQSSFRADEFDAQDVLLSYNSADSDTGSLTLKSSPADVRIEGDFRPGSVVGILRHAGTILAEALTHRLEGLDSIRATAPSPLRKSYAARGALPLDTVSVSLALNLRDLYPVGVLLGEHLEGSADIQGNLDGSLKDLSADGDILIQDFSMAGSTPLDLTGVNLSFSLRHLQGTRTIEVLHSDIALNAKSALIDSTLFTNVALRHSLRKDSSTYTLSGTIDSTLGITLEGTSAYASNLLDLRLSRLGVRISEHDFLNADPVSLQYGRDGIRFINAVVQHEAEEVVIDGVFDPTGYSDLRFSVENFLLNNLREFSADPDYVEKVGTFNGVLGLRGAFMGNLDKPAFSVDVNAEGVKIGETVFGKITGRGSYQSGIADMFVEFRSRPNEPRVSPELLVSGIMPVKVGSDSEFSKDQQMDLTLRSRGFRLEFLDPFIPVTSRLRGSLTGDIVMRGTPESPLYEGSLTFDETHFLFVPLGIEYNLKGTLVPSGKTIALHEVVLSNIPADRVPVIADGLGSMNLTGRINLEGLQVKQFDISANGQLLIMKESSRLREMPLYGNVYIGSGANILRWFGAPERSFVAGDVLIKNANITFPPSRNIILERAQMFTVSYIDDTSKTTSSLEPRGSRSLAMAQRTTDGPSGTEGQANRNGNEPDEEPSFLDNIVFNLTLETAGLTQVRFLFNPLTGEELYADLKGRLIFTNDESSSRVTGELEVGQRSYYKYFKTLQATGNLLFTGDIANP